MLCVGLPAGSGQKICEGERQRNSTVRDRSACAPTKTIIGSLPSSGSPSGRPRLCAMLARSFLTHRPGVRKGISQRTVQAPSSEPRGSRRNAVSHSWHEKIISEGSQVLHTTMTVRRPGEVTPDALLAHLALLGWQHINLTGDYL